ncbi:ubiquitin-like-specific protease 1 [Drosophila subpulchrella]|uniref:ubiquitin-like-specific protease 1 n=1 Tax=Drosophila subpulchrella TaxID=1486046 RepID=UPI0018A19933|nr:ubiquitin-like-specific protease 1 [Drosophila subpulchrella]
MAKRECGNQPNSPMWLNQANYSLLALEGQFIERERYLSLIRNECDMPNPHSLQPTRPEARANGNPSTSSYPQERVKDIILALERLLIFNRYPSGNKPVARPIATKKSLDRPKSKSLPYVVQCARQRRFNSCAFLKDGYVEQFRKQALQKSKKFKIFVAQALSEAKRTEDERRAFEQDMRKNKLKNCGLIPESNITIEDESKNKERFALQTNKTLNRPEPIIISEDFAQPTKHIVISDDESEEEETAIESFIISEDESDENENEDFAQPTQEPLNRPDLISEDKFEEIEEFPQLTKEHMNRLKELEGSHPEEFVVSKFKLDVNISDIKILVGGRWLNDVVINFYMNLLTDRSEKRSGQLPSVYSMNTFFMPRLLQSGFEGVKRWTRKVDILSKDIILIPVHCKGVHWTMTIIDMRKKSILYYDSKGGANQNLLDTLEKYLREESLDKRNQSFDTSNFRIEKARNVPQQKNNSDCGVFSCMFAEYITRNAPITFSQDKMVYFRKKMALEIMDGELWK